MEHFLSKIVSGEPGFKADAWYNEDGDCLEYQCEDVAVVADRIDGVLTLYRSALDARVVGFKIKDVKALLMMFGGDGLAVEFLHNGNEIVSIRALVMAAYFAADEPGTAREERKQAYDELMKVLDKQPPVGLCDMSVA